METKITSSDFGVALMETLSICFYYEDGKHHKELIDTTFSCKSITNIAREWPKLTKPVCLTDFTRASSKLTGECG